MMEKLFQRDLLLKVFSVVFAILLWAVVMQDYTTETTRTFEIPLHVIGHPSYVVNEGIEDGEATVEVRVTDKNLSVSRLRPEDFQAVVNYQGAVAGKSTVFEVKVATDKRVNYTWAPKTVTATLVENRQVEVPVYVDPGGGAITLDGRDWRWKASTAGSTATISGRSDYLVNVKQALVHLDASDLTPSVSSVTKAVIPVDTTGKTVDNLATTSVEVSLAWEQLPPGREVKILPRMRGTPPEGYVVTKLEVSPSTLIMRAASVNGALPSTTTLETAEVDVTGQSKSFAAPIRMVPPGGTTLSTETVMVSVSIAESMVERLFKGIEIQVAGAESNVESSLAITVAQVKIKGPYSLIKDLDSSMIRAYVDVEKLRGGKHLLPIKVNGPAGIAEAVVDPPVVETNIVIR